MIHHALDPVEIDLTRCLLARPESRTLLDSFDGNPPVQMWLALEEDPAHHSGYQIVFDDSRSAFGLAGARYRVRIGCYGSFVDTLEASGCRDGMLCAVQLAAAADEPRDKAAARSSRVARDSRLNAKDVGPARRL